MRPGLRLLLLILVLGGRAYAGEASSADGGDAGMNRLAKARSPYLRQHATNPVHWQPWGEDALASARRANKPIFLSVGYAACHWCHVMEHESFEDEATAKLLNDVFVCIKVDREERPDVDALYMQAVHVISGRGGWPMTVLLTPEGDPFWAGTYLPSATLQDLTRKVQTMWQDDEERLRNQAAVIKERVQEVSAGWDVMPEFEGTDEELLGVLDAALGASFDSRNGGYGQRPKFPPHADLLYLLDRVDEAEGEERLRQLRGTLVAMAHGGIHDHVGGGFHRYSTDADWLLPHFEKMLYDNALLAQAYAGMYARTEEPFFRKVAADILGWVRREMLRDGGGYASSLDADTEGEEGLTYTWTVDEIRRTLAKEDAELVIRVYGLKDEGNFRDEATRRLSGRNIFHVPRPLEEVAKLGGMTPEALETRLDRIRAELLQVRDKRAQPGLDDKIITAWNGLLLSAFARVGKDTGDAASLKDGRALATFLLDRCRLEDGTLLRFPKGDGPELPAFAEDHVHLIEGLLDLAEATGESRWADEAAALARDFVRHFDDEAAGGFWTTSLERHEPLFARRKETFDSPIPSDNGSGIRCLVRLADRDPSFIVAADRALLAWRPLLSNSRAARGTAALYRALWLRGKLAGHEKPLAGDVVYDQAPIRADLFLERAEAKPGSTVAVALRVVLAPGWHVNAHRPTAENLIATTLEGSQGPATLEGVAYPEAVARSLAGGQPPGKVLEDTFWVRGRLRIPADAPLGPRRVPLVLTLQPCSGTACEAPRRIELVASIRFADAEGERRHEAVFGQ